MNGESRLSHYAQNSGKKAVGILHAKQALWFTQEPSTAMSSDGTRILMEANGEWVCDCIGRPIVYTRY